eukprot:TRINITY_DN1359_c0_g1_i2.p1 TRINITY_DN1359_c0_g1~~TRINITY_DN1359_c0_g1_i2.p1  ORF type:complete len:153 (-),score=28.16 TRINITY_DN1359_c0_g1_i2:411-869(-)
MAAATAFCAGVAPAGLGVSSLRCKRVSKRVQLKSAFFTGTQASFLGSSLQQPADMGRVTCFARDWLRKDLSVIGFGIIGWMVPSSIPAINGDSLSGLFFSSIGPELAHFPTGPAIDSPFWLWMVTWHVGLFLCLFYGQIGIQARKEGGYLDK